MNIIIVYELPQRELENDLLLKSYLESKGHNCELIKYPFMSIRTLRKKYYNKIDAICVQSLRNETILFNLVYYAFGKVPLVIDMQVEQINTNKTENDFDSYFYPKGAVRLAYHICWGEKIKEKLFESGIEKRRLLQTGPIQMDFLRPEFKSYYYNREELLARYGISNNQKICLFISSFSYVGLSESNRKSLKTIIGEDEFNAFEKVSNESFEELIKWLDQFLATESTHVIIYRKHPAEEKNGRLLELEKKYPKSFRLISDHSVKQWILIADNILTWYSTSVAEAYFANKNVAIIRPERIDYDTEVALLNGSEKICSYEKFIEAITGEIYSGLDSEIIEGYYDVNQTIPSFKRIGDEIIRLHEAPENYFPWDLVQDKFVDSNKKQKREDVIALIYGIFMRSLLRFETILHVRLKGNIQVRLDKQLKEKEKRKEEKEEIERIIKRAPFFRDIVKAYTDVKE